MTLPASDPPFQRLTRFAPSPTGRLHGLCPLDSTHTSLYDARCRSYRLPFAAFIDAVAQLAYCRTEVYAAASMGTTISLADPGTTECSSAVGV